MDEAVPDRDESRGALGSHRLASDRFPDAVITQSASFLSRRQTSLAGPRGRADDLIYVPDSTVERKRNAAAYKGGRRAVMEQLRHDETAKRVTVPAVRDVRRDGRGAIYLRVSTEEQARVGGGMEGYSIPYQREACRRKANEMGLAVVEEYVDPGYSGRTTRRPDFERLLNDLAAGRITHVIVHKLDRLGRSKQVDYAIDEAIEAAHAHLVSVMEYIDDTPAGKLNLHNY